MVCKSILKQKKIYYEICVLNRLVDLGCLLMAKDDLMDVLYE